MQPFQRRPQIAVPNIDRAAHNWSGSDASWKISPPARPHVSSRSIGLGPQWPREKIGRVRIDLREVEVGVTLAFLTSVAAERQFVGDSLTKQRGAVSFSWHRPGVVDEMNICAMGVSGMPSSRVVVPVFDDGAMSMPGPGCGHRPHCAVQR